MSMPLMSPCVAADEVQWEKGCVSGAVYWGDKALTDLLVKVGIVSAHSNTNRRNIFVLIFVSTSLKSVDLVVIALKITLIFASGLWGFCLEQSTSPGHFPWCAKDGGRSREDDLHALSWWTKLLWNSMFYETLAQTPWKPNLSSSLIDLVASTSCLFARLLQGEPKAF